MYVLNQWLGFCSVFVCDIQALLETHQVPLLVPHGVIKQLIHWAVPALPEGRPLVAAFLVLLLCPQHLRTAKKGRHLVSLVSQNETIEHRGGEANGHRGPLTRSSSDSRLVMWSALRFILLG